MKKREKPNVPEIEIMRDFIQKRKIMKTNLTTGISLC